jgi:hydrogenase expression/formation protein HypE
MAQILPVGKVPRDILERLLAQAPTQDPHVLLRPGIGLDCAVVEVGDTLLVLKSDPITFATDAIGWYVVQVTANDLATTGATPRWLMVTMLLPEARTTAKLVERISQDVYRACREIGVTVIGGHTEITAKLDRPILVGTLIGEVDRERLVTPQGAREGDRILLTKGVPIEATAILAREFPDRARRVLSAADLRQARAFLYDPGISVLREARIAQQAGQVTAMHDPTEGGLATALWELAEASGRALTIDRRAVPIPPLAARVCQAFGLDPLNAIASGALLFTATASDAPRIRRAIEAAGITCAEIGEVADGPAAVWHTGATGREPLPCPVRDAIAQIYEV